MLRTPLALLAVALVVGAPPSLPADTPPPKSPADCTAPEHRQFDFWLGTWDVNQNGKAAGVNRITADLKGCVLVEQWTSASGGRGTSLNFYDRRTTRWHQTWIDEGGNGLLLSGAFADGRMVLSSAPNKDGAFDRITWSVQPDGSVRQVWEQTKDGRSWATAFDGRYVRRKAS